MLDIFVVISLEILLMVSRRYRPPEVPDIVPKYPKPIRITKHTCKRLLEKEPFEKKYW